jgi:hypothetical protein
MALTTRSDLLTAVANWLDRDDLEDRIPEFIALAEATIRRRLRSRFDVARSTLTLPSGEVATSLPDACRSLISIAYDDEGTGYAPDIRVASLERVEQHRVAYGATGVPKFVAIVDRELVFSPTADADYTVIIAYEALLQPLTVDNPTNDLLTEAPDVYLYGTLAETAAYLADDSRLPLWTGRLEKALLELEVEKEYAEFSANTLTIRPKRAL